MNAASRRGTLALRRAGSRYMRPRKAKPAPTIGTVQIGRGAIQGHLVARWREDGAPWGSIMASWGDVVIGPLLEAKA